MIQSGMFVWNELITNDTDVSGKFYKSVFDWDSKTMTMPSGGEYTVFEINGEPVAGMLPLQYTTAPEGTPNHWFSYIAVEDAEQACMATKQAGGTVIREPFFIPRVGTLAILASSEGSCYGIMQPSEDDCESEES